MSLEDSFQELGVSKDATMNQLTRAYHKKQKEYEGHPRKLVKLEKAYGIASEYCKNKAIVEGEVISSGQKKEEAKAVPEVPSYFLPRVIAYVIDISIISVVASLLFALFPQAENVTKLTAEVQKVQEQYLSQEITTEEYVNQTMDLNYDISYQNVIYTIIDLALVVGYFVIYQWKANGQTLGKRVMQIRTVSANGEKLTMNQYLYRSLIVHAVLFNLFSLFAVLFFEKSMFGPISMGLEIVQMIVILVCIFMVVYRKDGRGLHDLVANTRVVMANEKELIKCEN